MGVSTDGILAFGFDSGAEEGDLPEWLQTYADSLEDEDSFDPEEFIAAKMGLPEWQEDGPDDFWKTRWAAVATCPIELVTYCSYDYQMYLVAIRGTEQRAKRGYRTEVDTTPPTAERIAEAKAWCEAAGIPWQEPKWLLVSMWG
jgi:hypothetical protein